MRDAGGGTTLPWCGLANADYGLERDIGRRWQGTARAAATRGMATIPLHPICRGARRDGGPQRNGAPRGRPRLQHPALRDLALVGASYGIAHRTLGTVSLVGPLRMDYEKAIRSVRAAAFELSRLAEDVYGAA